MSEKNNINIENRIMDQIISGKIKMKPKWYFVIGTVLSFIGLIGSVIGAVFLTNITLFLLRKQGPGSGRLDIILESLPLWIPLLAVSFMILGIWLLKKYDFSYKKNFLVVTIFLLVAIFISAQIINLSGLNEVWSTRGPLRKFYQDERLYKNRPNRRLNNIQ